MPFENDLVKYFDSGTFALKFECHFALRIVETLYLQMFETLAVGSDIDAVRKFVVFGFFIERRCGFTQLVIGPEARYEFIAGGLIVDLRNGLMAELTLGQPFGFIEKLDHLAANVL